MGEFVAASRGVGAAGLTTGIIGTALGAMNSGILPGLFNMGRGTVGCCDSDSMLVNRYEAGKDARISELENEIKLRDANFYTLGQMNDMRNYVDRRLDKIEHQLCDQAVWNTAQTGALNCMSQQIAALNGLTKLVIPGSSICPEMMPRYNTWTAPAATETATG